MVWWEVLLIIIGFILIILGIIGAVAPVLPGPPLCWLSLVCLECTNYYDINNWVLIITGLFMLIITFLDYWIPAAGTKFFGGSKAGVWGSMVGVVAALLLFGITGIVGIILFPFLGALVGEMMVEKPLEQSFKAATGALLGFLAGTLMKILYGVVLLILYIVLLFI
ncbi:MAG: DUF456 domain-containing protein [Bacteroidales bacterium]|nr:DUF456 domain-containing protein [Bacteroidales bacterium]